MPTVKDENYYTVCGWMINRLHLGGNDLKIYALIYSFSRDGESEYKGKLSYLAEFTGASEKTVKRRLDWLEALGYIEKTDRNSAEGKSNTYKAVPLETVFEALEGGGQNDLPPVGQNDRPFLTCNNNINNNSDNNRLYRERKKEIYKNNSDIDFSKMTDEELVAWGERPPDFTMPNRWELFTAYSEEVEKRVRERKGAVWKGKVVISENGRSFERLKSHVEILDECHVSKRLKETFLNFLRHCYANGHLITNTTLQDIIFRLDTAYGNGDDSDDYKCKSLNLAISSGCYDIKEFRGESDIV